MLNSTVAIQYYKIVHFDIYEIGRVYARRNPLEYNVNSYLEGHFSKIQVCYWIPINKCNLVFFIISFANAIMHINKDVLIRGF
jgi:hypothetical protein